MRRSTLFASIAFATFATALLATPTEALASSCNNKVCFQGMGTGNVCQATTGQSTQCDSAGTNCTWDFCSDS